MASSIMSFVSLHRRVQRWWRSSLTVNLLLSVGRCTRTQHWSCAFRKERSNCIYLHALISFFYGKICETSTFSTTLVAFSVQCLCVHTFTLNDPNGFLGSRHESHNGTSVKNVGAIAHKIW